MEVDHFEVTLSDGRRMTLQDRAFAEKLPITKAVLDRIHGTDDVQNAIGALVSAVLSLEARGVKFDDSDFEGSPA